MDPGQWLELTVADNGVGIAHEALPHVFEPFFSTKPLHEGAGLGLAQVYGIVQQHGGHIKLDSEPRHGTLVTIYLPLQEEPFARLHHGERPAKRVLIVEESSELRDALRETLSGSPYNVTLVATGKEALDVVRREGRAVDLIVGDLAMPQMSGISLLQAVRSQNDQCRMIIVSAYPKPADVTRFRAEGIVHWLGKPLSLDELVKRVEEVLSA
jgi:CheY-like chemotaxis protein